MQIIHENQGLIDGPWRGLSAHAVESAGFRCLAQEVFCVQVSNKHLTLNLKVQYVRCSTIREEGSLGIKPETWQHVIIKVVAVLCTAHRKASSLANSSQMGHGDISLVGV